MFRSPELWADPEVFKPERFLQPNPIINPDVALSDAFMPFFAGPHVCLGKQVRLLCRSILMICGYYSISTAYIHPLYIQQLNPPLACLDGAVHYFANAAALFLLLARACRPYGM